MKKQGFNPYLPSWEYIPDGEPYVFNDRVYVYGSHDRFNGYVYCMNDYVCWSAPVDDLTDWRYEGIIYKKTDDPINPEGSMFLYAPDVTVGPDGRFYLYYVLDKIPIVSVAVSDTPAGKYEFYGYVKDKNGHRLGERDGDEPQFDPGVLTEGDKVYLYTGFSAKGDKSRSGAMATVLASDMVTIVEDTVFVLPSEPYSKGTGFEGHEFFEAPSIRKIGDLYYLVYSSVVMHELCYAVSKEPTKGFKYQGVIVSNNDIGIDTYKPADKPMAFGGNNHGGMVQIKEDWYIFYHRHTNGSNFSRQGCLEKIEVDKDGKIAQVEITSCGPNGGPLKGKGEYPAYIASHLTHRDEQMYTGDLWMDSQYPKITQDGKDGDEEIGYIMNMTDSATAGFKYFYIKDVNTVKIKVRGYCNGAFELKTSWDGEVLGKIPVDYTNVWTDYQADIKIPDGIHSLYFTYTGG
ncbi:hypothetical protein GCM10008932_22800 [Alkalibacterium iburiense]|uniref:Alpha-N-arabinofuranosidase n=1 Tax=Alkalibacterium iburiense TaxID=290589 RepID=A0ABN0XR83_9LACT